MARTAPNRIGRFLVIKLWLDDVRPPPNKSWIWAETVKEAIDVMRMASLVDEEVAYASLDHDLGAVSIGVDPDDVMYLAGDSRDGSGYDFVKWMVENNCWPTGQIVVHSWNSAGARRMCNLIDEHGPYAEKTQYIPYDVRTYTEKEDSSYWDRRYNGDLYCAMCFPINCDAINDPQPQLGEQCAKCGKKVIESE
jgi:NAD+-processing family protein with receiver domain